MSQSPDMMELAYAVKLLAKTTEEVDKRVASVEKILDGQREAITQLKDLVTTVNQKLELLPLVLAGKLEDLIQKRSQEAYEDIRLTLDELRNKLYAIKRQIKDQTGAHQLHSAEMDKKEQEEGISVHKGGFRLQLPFGDGWGKALKIALWVIGGIVGATAGAGGMWALVDRITHALRGGG